MEYHNAILDHKNFFCPMLKVFYEVIKQLPIRLCLDSGSGLERQTEGLGPAPAQSIEEKLKQTRPS
jgi:hypothetical protein